MPSAAQTDPKLIIAQRLLTYGVYSLMLVFGTIGNLFNVILFFRKTLRKTSCNNYFLAFGFTNLTALNVAIISLLYMEIHPDHMSVTYCKIEAYVMTFSLQMSRYFILFACFDRFALSSSNAQLRKFASVHVARCYVIPTIIVVWLIIPLHVPIFMTINDKTCTFQGAMELYNCIYSIVFVGTIPPGLMFLFSILIFRNLKLRQKRRQIHPFLVSRGVSLANPQEYLRRKDQQVLVMLLVQVFAYVASTTPYTITLLYVVVKFEVYTSEESVQNQSTVLFILFFTDMFRFICPFVSFYLFVTVSRFYRKEMLIIISTVYRRCCSIYKRNNNQGQIELSRTTNRGMQSKRTNIQQEVDASAI